MKNIFFVAMLLLCARTTYAQTILKPGFNATEYLELLDVFDVQNDTNVVKKSPQSLKTWSHLYQSPDVGMANRFDIWLRPDGVGVLCIRGTIPKAASWIENFYAAMVPAIGSIQIGKDSIFQYRLSADSNAHVHVGWTTGLGFMAPLMIAQINRLYAKGMRELLIFGHSQGGALAFLTRSYLEYSTAIPKDITYKTYGSAPPKPGDLYYAYDLDFITRGGWALRVVNSMDWVPESPFSIQTVRDWNPANGLANSEKMIGKQKFYVRWYLNSIIRKMDRSTTKATKRYQKYLGNKASKLVQKTLTGFSPPSYANSMNYMTAGTPVILMANDAYKQKFIFNGDNIFVHHLLSPYRFLVNAYYPQR